MRWTIVLVALLAGCGGLKAGSLAQASSSSAGTVTLGVVAGLAVIIFATSEREGAGAPATRPAPELAPDRTVSEQDCTKPIDHSLGNIRCK